MTEKKYALVRCAHCDGEGCLFCDKKGNILVLSPPIRCNQCEGVGCIYCGYTGWSKVKGKYE